MSGGPYPETPDGRYFLAKGRLWRRSDPRLPAPERQRHVDALMAARRAVRNAAGEAERRAARSAVDEAKRALGERGPVWWDDGAPDVTGMAPRNTGYAAWFASLAPDDLRRAGP